MKSVYLFFIFAISFTFQCMASENNLAKDDQHLFIKQFLDQYKRPFTVLSVSSNTQDYSFNIAQNYDAVCVMVPTNIKVQSDLFDLCQAYDFKNTILLGVLDMPNDLKRMSECEHVDIILAMNNFLGQSDSFWQQQLDALLNMGDYLILEIDNSDLDKTDYLDYIKANNINVLLKESNHYSEFYVLSKQRGKILQRRNWIYQLVDKKREHVIESSFITKSLVKKIYVPTNKTVITEWHPGINLVTFKLAGGIFPKADQVKKGIEEIKDNNHGDWMPQNMVLQGKQVELIDFNDVSSLPFSIERRQKLLMWIDLSDPEGLVNFFHVELAERKGKDLIDWEKFGQGRLK